MSEDEIKAASRLSKLLENSALLLGRELTIPALVTFLTVIQNEGISGKEIADLQGVPQSTLSAQLRTLSERSRDKKPGLGLVAVREDIYDARMKRYSLTPKGRNVARNILSFMLPPPFHS